MRIMGRAKIVGITRAPFISEDGGALLKACDTTGGGRAGAVVVDVGSNQHQALQHAERKARTYGKALLGVASLLCLSVCGNFASFALSILVFEESLIRGAIQPRSVVLSDSKAAAPVGTGLATYDKDTPVDDTFPLGDDAGVSLTSVEVEASVEASVKRCAIAPSGTEACWELADPAMTDIPDSFLEGHAYLTGMLKVGAAVKTIGAYAFANTKFTSLDLSGATSLVEIGQQAFARTGFEGKLVIPATVTTIGSFAFANTKFTSLDLSNAAALVEIEAAAFYGTGLKGMIVTPFKVPRYQDPLDEKDNPADETFPIGVSIVSVPGVKRCAIAPSGTEACWELADPTMTDIPEDFLEGNTYLTGTLKVGAAIKTIGTSAFAYTKLTGLDLSGATSLATIGDSAFFGTNLGNTLVIPATVTAIGTSAFTYTKLTGLDLTEATALVLIGDGAFSGTGLTGTIVIPASVTTIGDDAFYNTKLTSLDLSDATTLLSIGSYAFSGTGLTGTIVTPSKVPRYAARDTFPPGVSVVSVLRLEHAEAASDED